MMFLCFAHSATRLSSVGFAELLHSVSAFTSPFSHPFLCLMLLPATACGAAQPNCIYIFARVRWLWMVKSVVSTAQHGSDCLFVFLFRCTLLSAFFSLFSPSTPPSLHVFGFRVPLVPVFPPCITRSDPQRALFVRSSLFAAVVVIAALLLTSCFVSQQPLVSPAIDL